MKVQRLKEEKEAETLKLKEFENATAGIVSKLRKRANMRQSLSPLPLNRLSLDYFKISDLKF